MNVQHRTLNVERRIMMSLSAVVAIGYYPAFAAASAEYAGEVCPLLKLFQLATGEQALVRLRRIE